MKRYNFGSNDTVGQFRIWPMGYGPILILLIIAIGHMGIWPILAIALKSGSATGHWSSGHTYSNTPAYNSVVNKIPLLARALGSQAKYARDNRVSCIKITLLPCSSNF